MAFTVTPTPTPLTVQPPSQRTEEILLGRYRVLARRGKGGFGAVCTCWDTRLQRRVAIKRIPIGTTTAEGFQTSTMSEVLQEARTACLLPHPNIVAVHDFETDGEYAYIVMEYVDGLNLAELLARVEGGMLTHEECNHVVSSCAKALACAHENGVLHLDIKPTNIMIDRSGTVKLADFGMATLASAAGYGGARGGTVGYMPPEQIEGMLVDERADVFSLAVVTWQALTGKDPFAADAASKSLEMIYRGPKVPLTKEDPTLDLTAEDALLRALAPQASNRTPSVDELACELAPSLGDATLGQASLRELVDQSDDEEPEAEIDWEDRHLPWRIRFPWLWPALERCVPALVALLVVAAVLPVLEGASDIPTLVAALVVYAAASIWPPLGSALCGCAISYALATVSPTNVSFPLAGLVFVAFAAWWVAFGRQDNLSCAAVLLPCCTGQPIAGAQLAGLAMDPLPAAATGAASALLGVVFNHAAAAGFASSGVVYSLLPALAQPSTWVVIGGCALSALASSAVAMRGTVRSGIAGQTLGAAILVCFEVLAARVENGGSWTAPSLAPMLLAICLTVVLCIATVLRGPLFEDLEGEDEYELS